MKHIVWLCLWLAIAQPVYADYSYDVSGYGDDGSVYGNVDVDQSGGSGYVYDYSGNEHYVDVDWTGYGQLEGYDEEGDYYVLDVE